MEKTNPNLHWKLSQMTQVMKKKTPIRIKIPKQIKMTKGKTKNKNQREIKTLRKNKMLIH